MHFRSGAIAAGLLLAGCSGSEQVSIPDAANVAAIEICRGGCKAGKLSSADRGYIAQAVKATAAYGAGWQAEWQMQLSTAQMKIPPPEDSVPGLLALIEGDLPSGRYRVSELKAAAR